jgi:hypothetical protein
MDKMAKMKASLVMESFFEKLALGEERHAEIEELELQGNLLSGKVRIVSKEVMSAFGEDIMVYYLETMKEFQYDVKKPTKEQVKIQVETPLGIINGDMTELVPVINRILNIS